MVVSFQILKDDKNQTQTQTTLVILLHQRRNDGAKLARPQVESSY